MRTRTYFEEVLVVRQFALHLIIRSGVRLMVLGLEEEGTQFGGLFLLVALRVQGSCRGRVGVGSSCNADWSLVRETRGR